MPGAQIKALRPMRSARRAATIGRPDSRRHVMSTHRRIPHFLAAALVVTAITVPTANARPLYDHPGKRAEPAPIATVADADDGFDLGSAALGAGSASAFLLLTAAVAAGVGQRRHRVGVVS
jgi:hypothetical protein